MSSLLLSTPLAGEKVVFTVNETVTEFNVDFPLDMVLFEKVDDALEIYFEETDSTIVLDDFYATYHEELMPDFMLDGELIAGEDFFAAFDPELMPAMGYVTFFRDRANREAADLELANGTDALDGLLGESGYDAEGVLVEGESSGGDGEVKSPSTSGGRFTPDSTPVEPLAPENESLTPEPSRPVPPVTQPPTPTAPTTPDVSTPSTSQPSVPETPDYAPELDFVGVAGDTANHETYDDKDSSLDRDTDLDSDAQTVEGSFTVKAGDGATTITITASNGASITITLNANGNPNISSNSLEGEFGNLTVAYDKASGTVNYTYTQNGNANHTNDGSASDDILKDGFDINVSDSDNNSSDDASGRIEITINDDGPSISNPNASFDELNSATPVVSFDLDDVVNFGADGEASIDSITFSVPSDSGYTLSENELFYNGVKVGTVELDNVNNKITINTESKDASFENKELPNLELNYTVQDADGDTASGSLNASFDFDYGNATGDGSSTKQDIRVEITTDNVDDGAEESTDGLINADELATDKGINVTITLGPDAKSGDTISVTLKDSAGNEYTQNFNYDDLTINPDKSFEVNFPTPEGGFPEGGVSVGATITDSDGNSASSADSAKLDTVIDATSTGSIVDSSDDTFAENEIVENITLGDDVNYNFEDSFELTQGENAFGKFTVDAEGNLLFTQTAPYQHAGDKNSATITVQVPVIDKAGNTSFVEVEVNVADSLPTTVDDSASLDEGASIEVSQQEGLLADDTDSADGGMQVTGVTGGEGWSTTNNANGVITVSHDTYGTLEVQPNGSYTFTSNPNSVDTDITNFEFTYTVTDSDGDTASSKLTIDVENAEAPVLNSGDDSLFLDEENLADDSAVVTWKAPDGFTATGFVVAENAPYSVELNPTTGELTVKLDKAISHTDENGKPLENGANDEIQFDDSITVTVKDANGNSFDVTLDVNVSDDDINIDVTNGNPEQATGEITIYDSYVTEYTVTLKDGTSQIVTGNPYITGWASHVTNKLVPSSDGETVTATQFKPTVNGEENTAGVSGQVNVEAADDVSSFTMELIAPPKVGTDHFIDIDGTPVGLSSVTNSETGEVTYTASLSGETYFTLTLNSTTGKWTFVQNKAFETAINIKVTGTDGDGDTDTQYISIPGSNEIVSIDTSESTANLFVDEANLAEGSDTDTDALTQEGVLVVEGDAPKVITIDGVEFTEVNGKWVSADGSNSANVENGSVKITSVIENNGSYEVKYEFTLNDSIDSGSDASTTMDNISFNIGIEANNGTTTSVDINVNVKDDAPLDVADISTTTSTDTAVVLVRLDFGADDGAGKTIEFNGETFTYNEDGSWTSSTGETFTSEDGSITLEVGNMTLTNNGGSELWSATINGVPEDGTSTTVKYTDADGDSQDLNISVDRGDTSADVVVGLDGTATQINPGQDYNIAFILDTSGSMYDEYHGDIGGKVTEDGNIVQAGDEASRLGESLEAIYDFISTTLLTHANSELGGNVNIFLTTFWGNTQGGVGADNAGAGDGAYTGIKDGDGVEVVLSFNAGLKAEDLKAEILEQLTKLYDSHVTAGENGTALDGPSRDTADDGFHWGTYYGKGFNSAAAWFKNLEDSGAINEVFLMSDGNANDTETARIAGYNNLLVSMGLAQKDADGNYIKGADGMYLPIEGSEHKIHGIGMGTVTDAFKDNLDQFDTTEDGATVVTDSNISDIFSPDKGNVSTTNVDTSIGMTAEGDDVLLGGIDATILKNALQKAMGDSIEVTNEMLIEYMHNYPEWVLQNAMTDENDPDLLLAGGGNDLVYGQGGDDVIIGDGNSTTLESLASKLGMSEEEVKEYSTENIQDEETDTIELVERVTEHVQDAVDEALEGDNSKLEELTETIESLENTTDGNDLIYGGTGNDVLMGLGGDDTLMGDEGEDILFGGSGNDFIFGGDGDDILFGGTGNDVLIGGTGSDILIGGDGKDVFTWESDNFEDGVNDIIRDFKTGDVLDLSCFGKDFKFEVKASASGATEDTYSEIDIIISKGGESQTITLQDVNFSEQDLADLKVAMEESGTFTAS